MTKVVRIMKVQADLHAPAAHPQLVDGEGCKVVSKERHAGVEQVVFQQGH